MFPTVPGSTCEYASGRRAIAEACSPALVGERRRADVRLPCLERQVRDLRDRPRRRGQRREPARRQQLVPALELEAGDDREQVRVAAPLAVAVGCALHVQAASGDGDHRVGHRAGGVVVEVHADGRPRPVSDLRDNAGHVVGQGAAVGVAQHQRVGAGVCGGGQHLKRVAAISEVAVEEVLGVEHHAAAGRGHVGDRVGDHGNVLCSRVVRSASSTCSVQDLPTSVTIGVSASSRARRLASSSTFRPGSRVAPNAASVAFLKSIFLARSKNSASFGLEPGQPPSITSTPSPSSAAATRSLSATVRSSPTCCEPSRRVVS